MSTEPLIVGAVVPVSGVDGSRGFTKRASRIVSQAGLYQLVEDMAKMLDEQKGMLNDIHAMCTRILEKMIDA